MRLDLACLGLLLRPDIIAVKTNGERSDDERRQHDLFHCRLHGCLLSSCRCATTAAISASLSVMRLMTATPASAARTRISSAPRISGALNCAPPLASVP